MTKKFEVGSYAINNKGIGIAGPARKAQFIK